MVTDEPSQDAIERRRHLLRSPKELNSFAVNTVVGAAKTNQSLFEATRSDALKGTQRAGVGLPAGYGVTARRVTLAMIAMPVAIVTSWVLWERFALGQERKKLVRPDSTKAVLPPKA